MVIADEHEHTKTSIVISIIVTVIIAIVIANAMLSEFSKPYYAAPGSHTETWGAPDGEYLQKDWGYPDNIDWGYPGGWVTNVTSWTFTMDDHDYLGPLHGSWKVANGTAIPIWHNGVFPIDSRLYITIKDNTIVNVIVRSAYEYGN